MLRVDGGRRSDGTPKGTPEPKPLTHNNHGKTMALKNLSNEEMAAVSSAWVDPAHPAYEAMRNLNRLLALSPKITARHAAINALTSMHTPSVDADTTASRTAELDQLHDTLATAVYDYLGTTAQLADNCDELFALREELMPQGLSPVVLATYREQAGFAAALRRRLDPTLRARLMALPLPNGTLLEKVDAWMATAVELGRLAEARARSEAQSERGDGAHVMRTRNDWIRMVNAVIAVARMSELEPALDYLLFGQLTTVEATADLRAARRIAAVQVRRSHSRVSEVIPKVDPKSAGDKTQTG